MTTHPAPSPFVFDPARVSWVTEYEGGCRWHTVECWSPIGRIGARGEESQGLLDTLHSAFDAAVRDASAHQRMAWAASAQKEVANA